MNKTNGKKNQVKNSKITLQKTLFDQIDTNGHDGMLNVRCKKCDNLNLIKNGGGSE